MTPWRSLRSWLLPLAATAAAITAALAPALADDRDLLRLAQEKPYVFIVLDSSGSMNWQPLGDLFAPANGDDPNSKMYQAKSALFRVLSDPDLDGIHWGFGTYNQDSVRAYKKHWLYRVRTAPAGWPYPSVGEIQIFGDACLDDSDGDTTCDSAFDSAADSELGRCPTGGPGTFWAQDLATRRAQMQTFPILGDAGTTATNMWLRESAPPVPRQRFRVRWNSLTSGAIGDDTITASVTLTPYDSGCNPGAAINGSIVYDRAYTVDGQGRPLAGSSDVLSWVAASLSPLPTNNDPWDNDANYFDTGTSNTCQASSNPLVNPERNSDSTNDQTASTYNVKTKTINDPLRPSGVAAPIFSRGDFVPLDWKDGLPTSWTNASVPASHRLTNRDFILRRLAPNYTPGMLTAPDFRVAPYYADHPTAVRPTNASSGIKPLAAYADVPPIMASGATPLGNSIRGFTTWFDSWKPYAEASVAAGGDDKFICRTTNVLLLTDGDESCYLGTLNNTTQQETDFDYNPCWAAKDLWTARKVKTFVFGFGNASATGNSLSCIANEGGTGALDYDSDGDIDGPGVFFPTDEDALVAALKKTLLDLRSGNATFASAAVPSVQADAADKVVLTEFTPIKEEPIWPGRVYSFIKPVPINEISKQPDLNALCADETDTACFAWEAQAATVEEQVKPNSVSGDYIGPLASQRRVYYPEQPGLAVPRDRHYLDQTDGTTPIAQKRDLWNGLRIPYTVGDPTSEGNAQDTANTRIDAMHKLKSILSGTLFEFVMGDNFHSDPLALGSPGNSAYFRQDAGASLATACTDDANDDDRRYTRFAFKQERRRRMLALGTNEGALHFFDIGIFRPDPDPAEPGKFTNGTGQELIAFVPRQVMPQIMSLYDPAATEPQYTVDGKTLATDVLIDPIHSGFGSGSPPTACDRRWRTVLLGGLREGGARASLAERPRSVTTSADYPVGSYYALDVTQPDPVVDLRALDPDPNHLPFYVPKIDAVNETVPTCAGNGEGAALPADCGPLAFGSPLWEFTDSVDGIRLDEDDNGHIDMAFTWSTPNTGRMRVCTANCASASLTDDVLEDRFVAIFGGGIDPNNRNIRGNWLYIVDIETGEAIYKQRLRGSAAAEPAAVDLDFDGYLDRVYIGDTYGLMYRVDLFQTIAGGPPSGGTKYPGLTTVTVSETDPGNVLHSRAMQRITDTTFRPRVLFNATGNVITDTTLSATLAAEPQSIYYPPSVLFVPAVEKYALAFGTGNRFDITALNEPAGRFFVLTDDWAWNELPDATVDAALPTNRSALFAVDLLTAADPNADYLSKRAVHRRGWAMLFDDDERLVSEPLAISGVLLFSMFTPVTTVTGDDKCEHSGQSRLFGVFVTNTQGILDSNPNAPGSTAVRYRTVLDLTTSFYVEQTQTGNPPEAGQTYGEITEEERDIMENVKKFLPRNCSFPPGYGVRINTRTSRGGIEGIAPIPLCVIESNFKEE